MVPGPNPDQMWTVPGPPDAGLPRAQGAGLRVSVPHATLDGHLTF